MSDFAYPNSVKAVLLQISLRSEIVIFNNNFVFCLAGFLKPFMISFSSMPWVAGWFPLREKIKRTSVFYLVCLKKYKKKLDKRLWRGLFCERCEIKGMRRFSRNLKKVLPEVWKDKNTKENIKEIKEHEISNTLHWGLSVVPQTDDEIYVSISIGEYIIIFLCFLHCAKEGRVVENIESEVATWKIFIEKISMLKW